MTNLREYSNEGYPNEDYFGEESDLEEKDYQVDLEAENIQLKLILTSARRKSKEGKVDIELTNKRMGAVREALGCNTEYGSVRAEIDKINRGGKSGTGRISFLNEVRQNQGKDTIESEFEYNVLNSLLMRVAGEVKMLKEEKNNYHLPLAIRKGKALKEARDNTEYGARLQEEKEKFKVT